MCRWYSFGPQGETRSLADETGTIVDTYAYTAYGCPIGSAGPDPNPFRYDGSSGYYTDSSTGLILCGARWYDPSSTRWLSRDPIGYNGGLNLYAYCAGNPVSERDPSGTDLANLEKDEGHMLFEGFRSLSGMAPMADLMQNRAAAEAGNGPLQQASANNFVWDAGAPALGGVAANGLGSAFEGAPYVATADSEVSAGAVIGRMSDLNNYELQSGQYTLLDRLPDLGSPQANYYQNMSVLRAEMRNGQPILDVSGPDTDPAPTDLNPCRTIRQTFTGAERNQLRNNGWTFNGQYWMPPGS